MEENKELKSLYTFLQSLIYAFVLIDITLFVLLPKVIHAIPQAGIEVIKRISILPLFSDVLVSKMWILFFIAMVSIGTKAKKDIDLNVKKKIFFPLLLGLFLLLFSVFLFNYRSGLMLYQLDVAGKSATISLEELWYITFVLFGSILVHTSLDNISKLIKANLMSDRFNLENESFDQQRKKVSTPYSVNLPIRFYYKKKLRQGWMNIVNPFRGTMVIGTPGSGKTFSVIIPFIKQLTGKGFSTVVYDFKYPDLGKLTYYHYLISKQKGLLSENHRFNVINLNDVEHSRRINPLHPDYITSLADATETAEALIKSLKKSEGNGSDQFFTQSAINMLAATIYFFASYQKGRYSSFPHVLAFLNQPYHDIFNVLLSNEEIRSLLNPFYNAYTNEAYEQLEGQLGTLKINVSRLATKETFWVFSGHDFNLKVSDLKAPSSLLLANDSNTQEINSACYSLVINRLLKLINQKDKVTGKTNNPVALIIDEVPTLYLHKIENLIATARSNKVAVLLGLQELPQFKQQYGKDAAETICSVIANVITGSVRDKHTLDWLEKLFGRIHQIKKGVNIDRNRTSINLNEQLDFVIPASKIAKLEQGQLAATIAQEAHNRPQANQNFSLYNCEVYVHLGKQLKEEARYPGLPKVYDFKGEKEHVLKLNMRKINQEVQQVIEAFAVKS